MDSGGHVYPTFAREGVAEIDEFTAVTKVGHTFAASHIDRKVAV